MLGCVVNGPGEAREADLGIAAGNGKGVIFRSGEIVRHVPETEMVDALLEEVAAWEKEHETPQKMRLGGGNYKSFSVTENSARRRRSCVGSPCTDTSAGRPV